MIQVERRPDKFNAIQVTGRNEEELAGLFPNIGIELDPETDELRYVAIETMYSGPRFAPAGLWLVWQDNFQGPVPPGYGPDPQVLTEEQFRDRYKE